MKRKEKKIEKKEVLTVPKGTEITEEHLIKRKKYNYWENNSQWFAFLMLLLFPLIILPASNAVTGYKFWHWDFSGDYWYYNITDVKTLIFRLATIAFTALCVLTLVTYILDPRVFKERWAWNLEVKPYKVTLPQIFLVAYMLWNVVSAIFSKYDFSVLWRGCTAADVNVGIRTEGLYHMFLYGLIFLLLSVWGEYSSKYIKATAIMTIPFSLICLLQIYNVNLFYPADGTFFSSSFIGTLGNVDCAGGFAAMIVPFLFCAFVVTENKWRYVCLASMTILGFAEVYIDVDSYKVGLLAALVVVFPFLITSIKRIVDIMWGCAAITGGMAVAKIIVASKNGAKLSMSKMGILLLGVTLILCGGAYLLGLFGKNIKISRKKLQLTVLIIEAVVVVIALVALFIFPFESQSILHEAHNLLHGELDVAAGGYRGYAWKVSGIMISEHPITGAGPGTFYYEYYPRFATNVPFVFDLAHNDFIQIAVHSGYIGLFLYLAFLGILAYRAGKAALRSTLVIPFIGAATGYLAHVFFSFSISIVTPIFWIMIGLLEKCICQMPKEEKHSLCDADAEDDKTENISGNEYEYTVS